MRSVRPARPPNAGAPWHLFFLLGLALCVASCATKPPASEPEALAEYNQINDPLEPTNRVFYAINNGLDTVILRPLALSYRYALPEPVRNGVHNFLVNLETPVRLVNELLEGRPRPAGDTVMRFAINTTVGVLGFFDPATGWGFPPHDADFGMTLASWGVPEGPFLFLPILGPSDPRDAAGFGVDIALDPFTWVGNPRDGTIKALNWARFGVSAVDARARVEDSLQSIKKTALDPYATFRSLYRQHRHAQIEEMRNDNRATPPAGSSKTTDQPAKSSE